MPQSESPATHPSTLAFINVTHPSGLKRHSTEIRKHVMRDISRARRRPKAKDIQRMQNKTATITNAKESSSTAVQIRSKPSTQAEKQVVRPVTPLAARYSPLDETNIHSFLYPIEVQDTQIQLVRNLFSQTNEPRRRPLHSIWFALMTTDLGAFHLLLATYAIANDSSPSGRETLSIPFHKNNTTALAYYNKSIENVKKRILKSDALSDDGLLIAVLSFLCYNVKVQNFEQWNVHMVGLERLVILRGGIDELNNTYMRLLTTWQDLCGAAALDISPRFPLSRGVEFHPAHQGTANRSIIFRSSLEQLRTNFSGFEETIDALEYLAGVSIFISNGAADDEFWENDIQTAQLIICSAHKALSLARPAEPENIFLHAILTPDIIIKEVLRRCLLVFIALLKVRADLSRAPPEMSKHLFKLKTLLTLPTVDWSSILELKLWALFICSLDLLAEDKEWRVGHIKEEMAKLQLDNSDGVLKVVKEIIWIEGLVPAENLRWLCAEIDGEI